jgi:hypothetical protein
LPTGYWWNTVANWTAHGGITSKSCCVKVTTITLYLTVQSESIYVLHFIFLLIVPSNIFIIIGLGRGKDEGGGGGATFLAKVGKVIVPLGNSVCRLVSLLHKKHEIYILIEE